MSSTDASRPEFAVFVRDGYRNQGIGSELLRHVVAYAADWEYDGLELTVSRENSRTISVYRNVDFEVIDERPMVLAMQLSLDQPIAKQVQRPPAER